MSSSLSSLVSNIRKYFPNSYEDMIQKIVQFLQTRFNRIDQRLDLPSLVTDLTNDQEILILSLDSFQDGRLPPKAIISLKNGKLHNDNGPAWVQWNTYEEYWTNGILNREDGPAIHWNHSSVNISDSQFWIRGVCLSYEDWVLLRSRQLDQEFHKAGWSNIQDLVPTIVKYML
jgi:hypothetical protein